jgi:Di-haem cytochrome c peroxidase
MSKRPLLFLCGTLIALGSAAFAQEADPAEVAIGERLFLETRFSQFFAAQSAGNANAAFSSGDPSVNQTVTTGSPQPGPFAGQAMNCRACHLVDEHNAALKNRTYADFARRSPIPSRTDGRTLTARNSPPLVNASLPRPGGILLHFDGEFSSGRELAIGTLTGRNFGWLTTEKSAAAAHIAHIIRDDNGTGDLAQGFGGSYASVLAAADTVPVELRLPKPYRVDVGKATDEQILAAVGRLLEAYMNSLTFAQDERGQFNGSPYDVFLEKNGLPRAPRRGESATAYTRRLLAAISKITEPKWVTNADRTFNIHNQDFAFGPTELNGLKIFFHGIGHQARTCHRSRKRWRRKLRRVSHTSQLYRLRLPQHGRNSGGIRDYPRCERLLHADHSESPRAPR